jgi:hypothetical protein
MRLPSPKSTASLVESLEPSVLIAVGEVEEQPLDLHATAFAKELLQAGRAKIGALHKHVDPMKALMLGQLVENLKDRAFWR